MLCRQFQKHHSHSICCYYYNLFSSPHLQHQITLIHYIPPLPQLHLTIAMADTHDTQEQAAPEQDPAALESPSVTLQPPIPKSLEQANMLKLQGNQLFKNNQFPEAIELYERAIDLCPEQQKSLLCVLNSNVSISYMKINNTENTIEYAKKAVELDPKYRKAWINLANSYNQTDKPEEALDAYKKAQELQNDSSLIPIILKLTKKVDQINEKRKDEVIDGLKGIGNSILGYFGMSLDNFKMNKNPDGTFGVSMQ